MHSARRAVIDFYREYFPNEASEVEKLEAIDSDPHSWLRGVVTPTVRRAVGTTSGGHAVAAIGDAAIAFDPLAGQGAQNAIVQVAAFVAAAASHKGEFSADWLREQFDRHWEERGNASAEVTRLFLGDRKYASHSELLFPAAAVSERVAAALFGFLSEPDRLKALKDREDVLALNSEIAGEPSDEVLSRFAPSSGFTASPLAAARV
ncbi:putative monooxygenase [Hoyosella subflava]|uniref:Possible monooxygenase n=1 Tax=Hoyosella subflava (strain DSM 45089 / JCM 17490 / NBRC 109087 / DQS3-9A1) TaxID=443218 RepID=F6EGS6_HOYSD|nr:putative monooxygenase [Hoyosella subflava]AEF42314.1 Possible monooxygenase [Hoyosella subflava DQS3-9A1]